MTVPADWQGFAEMVGGASGAMAGLLFVAVSLNAGRIAGHQGLRASAAQTLVLFLTPLIMAAILLTPVMLLFVASGVALACRRAAGWPAS